MIHPAVLFSNSSLLFDYGIIHKGGTKKIVTSGINELLCSDVLDTLLP